MRWGDEQTGDAALQAPIPPPQVFALASDMDMVKGKLERLESLLSRLVQQPHSTAMLPPLRPASVSASSAITTSPAAHAPPPAPAPGVPSNGRHVGGGSEVGSLDVDSDTEDGAAPNPFRLKGMSRISPYSRHGPRRDRHGQEARLRQPPEPAPRDRQARVGADAQAPRRGGAADLVSACAGQDALRHPGLLRSRWLAQPRASPGRLDRKFST